MPATRGYIYWYDFGPNFGHELSDKRPALILSRTNVNNRLHVAIALPMSSTEPDTKYLRQHIHVAEADSWASVRQIKFIDQSKLGECIGQATPAEMEKALETLVERLARTEIRTGTIQTSQGIQEIGKGSVCKVQFEDSEGELFDRLLLILDYNDGNTMAITVQIQPEEGRKSKNKRAFGNNYFGWDIFGSCRHGSSNPLIRLVYQALGESRQH